jgi:hypothetical protein
MRTSQSRLLGRMSRLLPARGEAREGERWQGAACVCVCIICTIFGQSLPLSLVVCEDLYEYRALGTVMFEMDV